MKDFKVVLKFSAKGVKARCIKKENKSEKTVAKQDEKK